jgi:Tripartite tricarboxylate transporter family receptor
MACCADQRDELFAPIRKERIAADQERADAILHHGRERGVVRRIGVLSSLAAGAATLPAASRIARAQAYPTLPVRMIVGFAAGGGADITARLIGQWLSERLGQPFLIENRPGAASNIAAETVVRSPADGYTLLLVSSPHALMLRPQFFSHRRLRSLEARLQNPAALGNVRTQTLRAFTGGHGDNP